MNDDSEKKFPSWDDPPSGRKKEEMVKMIREAWSNFEPKPPMPPSDVDAVIEENERRYAAIKAKYEKNP